MIKQKNTFKYPLLGKRVQMFQYENMGIVVEKESQGVCIYGTDASHHTIFCAIPLCHPKYLKGLEYTVAFSEENTATVSVGKVKVFINYQSKKCACNMDVACFGSDSWGQDVRQEWSDSFFEE